MTGNFDQALDIVRDIVDKYPVQLVNSINPFRVEGQKTGAFEIVDSLGAAPDYLAIPVATPAILPPTGKASTSTGKRASWTACHT